MELKKLKSLLGIDIGDASEDVSMSFIMDDVEETIKNYCNVDEVPDGLCNTAYRMAIDLYQNDNVGNGETSSGPVASITEGDTSVSFDTSNESFKDSVLKKYEKQLRRYRKVVF